MQGCLFSHKKKVGLMVPFHWIGYYLQKLEKKMEAVIFTTKTISIIVYLSFGSHVTLSILSVYLRFFRVAEGFGGKGRRM